MNILFVGLGNMGGPMALNLLAAGHELQVFDLDPDAVGDQVAAGASAVQSLSQLDASSINAAITMLPAGEQVASVYTSPEGLLQNLQPGCLLIDCSTIDVVTARSVAEQAAAGGFVFVDAPVSGGVSGAAAATLTFMVGGTDKGFAAAQPLLASMGKNIFHAGAAGNGQVAKICNNMLLGIHMIGTCEAFNLAAKLGLDAQTFYDISSTASGQNWSMTSYCPVAGPVPNAPSNNDYQPGFAAAMMLKDLRLAQQAAHKARAATPLGAQAEAVYALMESAGKEELDFSAVIKLISGSL